MERKTKSISGKGYSPVQPTKKQLVREYVAEFWQSQTVQEMAELLVCETYYVTEAARSLGVKCITDGDRIRQFIKDNPDKSAVQIAKKCSYTIARIKQMAKQMGIDLPKHEKVSHRGKLHEWHRDNDVKLQQFKRKRIKEPYTQSSSPYGIANEIHGINTK